MKPPSPTLLSKIARLVPMLLLIVAFAAAPAWGGERQKHEAQGSAATCCQSQSADPDRSRNGDDDDGGCCGKHCLGCLCPCAKLILISGLRLTPTLTSAASVLPDVVLSALSLSDADPIFHPPRV